MFTSIVFDSLLFKSRFLFLYTSMKPLTRRMTPHPSYICVQWNVKAHQKNWIQSFYFKIVQTTSSHYYLVFFGIFRPNHLSSENCKIHNDQYYCDRYTTLNPWPYVLWKIIIARLLLSPFTVPFRFIIGDQVNMKTTCNQNLKNLYYFLFILKWKSKYNVK